MTLVHAIIDLDSKGMTVEEWAAFAGENFWEIYVPQTPYSFHFRDMTEGWQLLSSVADWPKERDAIDKGWNCPGTYAFVEDPENKNLHPILDNSTIIFGETTQPLHRRMTHHVGAFKGYTTNMAGKWDDYLDTDLNHIKIWFRPHRVSDPDWEDERVHSSLMETQAHAFYFAIWSKYTKYNTRDLPSRTQVSEARKILAEKNILKG